MDNSAFIRKQEAAQHQKGAAAYAYDRTEEHWGDVPGYAGLYQVSDRGRVRGYGGKILRPTINSRGYKGVCLYKNKVKRFFYVHRLVLLVFVGPPPGDGSSYAMHLQNDRTNNNLYNLRYGSQSCNLAFTIDDGTVPRGNKKLDKKKAKEIKRLYRNGWKQREIAEKFCVARCTVSNVIIGRTWACDS